MKLTFISDAIVQAGSAAGIESTEYRAGTTAELPADVASMFLAQGVARPAESVERADKPRGRRADRA